MQVWVWDTKRVAKFEVWLETKLASKGLFMVAIHEDTVKARRGEAILIGE